MPTASTTEKGERFERDVEALLRLLPNVAVERRPPISGKAADLYMEEIGTFTQPVRLAVECKHHTKRLSRDAVNKIWLEYRAAIDAGKLDRVLLVTEAGIVGNAIALLDGLPMVHMSYRELFDQAYSAERLLQAALNDIRSDQLKAYYQRPDCYAVDLDLASQHIELYYSDLIDFAESERLLTKLVLNDPSTQARVFYSFLKRYKELGGTIEGDTPPMSLVRAVLADREPMTRPALRRTTDLLGVVDAWVSLVRPGVGLALLGSYGTGKSAFSRYLAHVLAVRYRRGDSRRIPLRIELRHFGSHQSIEGLLSHELANRHGMKNASFDTFQTLNAAGRFVIILDGFDEMREGMSSEALQYNFAELNRLLVGEAKVVLCGRPTVFENAAEQRRILTGADREYAAPARYVQATIAPMELSAIRRAIRGFVAVRRPELGERIDDKVGDLERELAVNEELQDLLSRPVHFVMVVRILPRWARPFSELDRARLYESFITQIIERELHRLARPSRYDAEARRAFAEDIALMMRRNGAARAIRVTSIPEGLVARYRRPDESLDDARRELVRACFLEVKAPDILYFPHKSFAEYLVASRIRREMRLAEPSMDALGVSVSSEIAAFLSDLTNPDDWLRTLQRLVHNTEIVGAYTSQLLAQSGRDRKDGAVMLYRAAASIETLAGLRAKATSRSVQRLEFRLAHLLEKTGIAGWPKSDAAVRVAAQLVGSHDMHAAVLAARAIASVDQSAATKLVEALRPAYEHEVWVRNGWLPASWRQAGETPPSSSAEAVLRAAEPVLRMRLLDWLAFYRDTTRAQE